MYMYIVKKGSSTFDLTYLGPSKGNNPNHPRSQCRNRDLKMESRIGTGYLLAVREL
jgi:hypothetical protein